MDMAALDRKREGQGQRLTFLSVCLCCISPLVLLVCWLQVAFQFAFTTVFGWYATFLFLRTGHLAAAVAAHAFCNSMGFPAFGAIPSHPRAWVIAAAFYVGVALFVTLLMPLTDPKLYGNALPGAGDNRYLALASSLLQRPA